MNERALWPMVTVVGIVCALITALVYSGLDSVSVIAVLGIIFSGVGTLVTIVLYGKISKVEQNTNGNLTAQNALVQQLVEHLKSSVPVEVVEKVE